MPKFDFYPSFNAGEVSPLVDARTSLDKYKSACRTLENFQILPYGGVMRRPGTQFLGTPKSGEVRLIGFNFSTSTRFVIEMGVGYLRFWKPDGTLVGSPLELSTPYTGSVLREIQFAQINDIMYFTHASFPPYKLSRLSDTNWTFDQVDWEYSPKLDRNDTETTIFVNGAIGTISMSASNPIFKSGHVGTKWDLKWKRLSSSFDFAIGGNWASASMDTIGAWDFSTFGTWNAVVRIMRTPHETWIKGPITASLTRVGTLCTVSHTDHGYTTGDFVHFGSGVAPFYSAIPYTITVMGVNTYTVTVANSGATSGSTLVENLSQMEVVREYDSNGDRNIITSGSEADRCGLKIWVSSYTSATNARALLSNNSYEIGGTVKINSVDPFGFTAFGSVLEWLGAESTSGYQNRTTLWQEPAFSGESGYPQCVALHQQRLCFGGTSRQPNTIWASEIDNFENFKLGTTAADSFQFTIAASEGNRINWMYSQQNSLLIGTSGDEWVVGNSDAASSMSATNIEVKRQSAYGSKKMRAVLVNDVLLFIQRNGRKVRELVYELNKDGWVAPDLTLLAEHITDGEIVEIAYQQQPDAILWCVRGDGALIAMTYERDQKVVGWHRHTIADYGSENNASVMSVATIYGNGTEDEVWMVVTRKVSGQDYRTIERFPLLWRSAVDSETVTSWRYLDGFSSFSSGAANRMISGLARFNGKTITVVQDGQSPVTRTVSSGAITVPAASAGYLGLPFTSTLTPMKLDAEYEDGTAQGRKKRIHKVIARVYKSRGGQVQTNAGDWYSLADTLNTGDQKILLAGAFGTDADITIRTSDPYPLNIIAILPVWDSYGNE